MPRQTPNYAASCFPRFSSEPGPTAVLCVAHFTAARRGTPAPPPRTPAVHDTLIRVPGPLRPPAMAPAHRRPPPAAASVRERYWPGVRGYSWSVARVAGLVPVVLVSGIMAAAYFVAVPVSLVPMLAAHQARAIVLLLVFHFIYLNVIANYALLVWSDPGRVPLDWKVPPPGVAASSTTTAPPSRQRRRQASHDLSDDDTSDDFEDLAVQQRPLVNRRHEPVNEAALENAKDAPGGFKYYHLMQERAYDGGWRYCRKCSQMKPDRSHHCSVCGVCILRMDHHCVFVATCVGFYNHKFFISFVFYAFLGCTFVAIVGLPAFFNAIGEGHGRITPSGGGAHGSSRTASLILAVFRSMFWMPLAVASLLQTDSPWATGELAPLTSALLVVGYILTAAFSFALSLFVLFHAYLVIRGRTTIEMYDIVDPVRAARIAGYDLGWRENLRLVLGNKKWHWPLPTRYGIEGDGLGYSRAGSPIDHMENGAG